VADNKFHCIILKGGDQYPYFPRPLLSEFDFSIPLTSAPAEKKQKKKKTKKTGEDDDLMGEGSDSESESEEEKDDEAESETTKLTQSFLLKSLQAAQLADQLDSASRSVAHGKRSALARLELEIDKCLLQMLAVECREGEERGMRALEIVRLMRDRTGRMIEAAGKVAERYGRSILGEKIRDVGERRVGGGESDEEDGEEEDVFA
jgi:chromosome transmission fidelity protein 4